MRTLQSKATVLLVAILSCPALFVFPAHGNREPAHEVKPVVAFVQRVKGHLAIEIDPDPSPGKDALYALSVLREKLGSDYPVVAIVDDASKVSDLYQVDGIAAKAGFDKVRTFISHRENGMMFEVKFGPAIPFSTKGPFDPTPSASPRQ